MPKPKLTKTGMKKLLEIKELIRQANAATRPIIHNDLMDRAHRLYKTLKNYEVQA